MEKAFQPTKFVIIGDLCMDVFMQIEQYPPEGGDGSVRQIHQHAGGSASNTAIALARFGNQPYLLTHCGKDNWAAQLLPLLESSGVSVDFIQQEEHNATGLTFLVVSDKAERTMFTYRGANLCLHPDEISDQIFDQSTGLHISSYACLKAPQSEAVAKAVQLATTRNLLISLDVGVEPAIKAGDRLRELFPFLSLVILGEGEAMAVTQKPTVADSVADMLARGVKLIALKMGERGCRLISRDGVLSLPGFQVDPVDSTGAGDAFCAGLLHGLSQGWELDLSANLANALGAMATTRWGAGEQLPTRNEICAFLRLKNAGYYNPTLDQLIEKLGCPVS